MKMQNKDLINANGIDISIKQVKDKDYISLTDMAKYRNSQMTGEIIRNWLRTRYTIEFMGVWERVNNQNFNIVDFEHIKSESGSMSREGWDSEHRGSLLPGAEHGSLT